MLRTPQIADILSFIVGGACLYFMLAPLVAWSLVLTGWFCGIALGWFMHEGGTTFNLVHGFAAFMCICITVIALGEAIRQSVQRLLGVEK